VTFLLALLLGRTFGRLVDVQQVATREIVELRQVLSENPHHPGAYDAQRPLPSQAALSADKNLVFDGFQTRAGCYQLIPIHDGYAP
jgi:hypothetical protein